MSNDYNAYITCVSGGRLSPNGAHDVVLSSSLTYQTGPLGNFYQGSTNLLNQGSTNADLLGLYAYTTQTNQVEEGTNLVTIGYHYVALDAYGNPDSTLWFGIPDYLADTNGALAAWEMKYFGHLGVDPNGDYDCTGTNNLQKYQTGVDPNVISFSFAVTNQYVTSSPIAAVVTVLCGVPSSIAVLVDNTNFSGATWNSYTSSNLSISIGSTNGPHDIWVGLRGLPTDATPTWDETTVILDSNTPAITITSPSNNVSFNASRVDVSGNFSAGQLQQITVNGVLVFINGTNFEALNVPLAGSTNTIIATIQDFNGDTNTATIYVVGVTNSDGSLNDPIELSATNVGGFYPLTVTFQVQTNFPGVFSNLFYDFNGDDIADYTTNNFAPLTYTYTTNGEYFPVVTVQTSVGRFSSLGGWNSTTLGSSNGLLEINVQAPPVLVSTISITDPVDLKWTASSNLYVLSGSTATITEYDTNGTSIRSKSGIGSNPSGLDVDAAGKVYVAVTGSNQVWRYYPTNSTFAADTTFGTNGCIGINSGATGTSNGQFNAPYDVAVSPDGGTISVSDSGNNRIQQFDTNGIFLAAFGSSGTSIGQFNTPEGLAYDSAGTLYIVDSGNSRIVLAQGIIVYEVTGANGNALGQFSGPINIDVGENGVYVADTSNNRIQSFDPADSPDPFSISAATIRFAVSTNLNQPAAVAAVDNLMNETFYIADTGNNRVLLYQFPSDDPTSAWTNMVTHAVAGDITGSMQYFSSWSVGRYQQAFLAIGTPNLTAIISQIGTLTPVYIQNGKAQYYFEQVIGGQTITFTVDFVKLNGVWTILEF